MEAGRSASEKKQNNEPTTIKLKASSREFQEVRLITKQRLREYGRPLAGVLVAAGKTGQPVPQAAAGAVYDTERKRQDEPTVGP